MVASVTRLSALMAFAAYVAASPCPFGQMAEKGELNAADTAKFFAARSQGSAVVDEMMHEKSKRDSEEQKRAFDKQEKFYKKQLDRRQLALGGGLLNGQLQPFTGALEAIDLPTPQEFGLAQIPDSAHPYVAPSDSDVRGMCPTLNTMANHGYINHNGITNFAQAADACQITLGFGYDTCVFLSALGLIAGGDLPTGIYSIGGEDSRVPNTIGPALGISKHGTFEIDQSITRQDTYFGNQADFEMDRWQRLVNLANANGGEFGLDTFGQERAITYQESRDTNPDFNAEVKHLAVSLAERVFIFRAMPNGTHETLADYQNVAPFYLNETFPDAWFRRSTPYSLPNLGDDIVALYALGPTELGQNEGLNNFIPLGFDFGALNGAEATCFLETSILDLTPGDISPVIVDNFDLFESFFQGAITPFFGSYDCDAGSYVAPGPDAGSSTPGVNAMDPVIVNGVYQ